MKNIKIVILLLVGVFGVYSGNSQEYPFNAVAELFRDGKFAKCIKLAEKYKKGGSGLPLVYQAMSIYQLRDDKKTIKKYKSPYQKSVELLKDAKSSITPSDSIPFSFVAGLKPIQDESLKAAKKQLKSGSIDEFLNQMEIHKEIFDNSHFIYTDYTISKVFESGYEWVIKNSDMDKKMVDLQKILNHMESSVSSLQKMGDKNYVTWYLKKIQDEINEQIEITKDSLVVKKIMSARLGFFSIKTDTYRNFSLLRDFSKGTMKFEKIRESDIAFIGLPGLKEVLGDDYTEDWSNPVYRIANTAEFVDYLSREEKNVILLMNLCRMNPALFEKTILQAYLKENESEIGYYSKSLSSTLLRQRPLELFHPDRTMTKAAILHATEYGESGKTGHGGNGGVTGRVAKYGFLGDAVGECCSYGFSDARGIVCQLLVDKDVSDLGHRKALLSETYRGAGVSIKYHAKYNYNCVIDFWE